MRLDGIHHISAITGDARGNLDFYTRVLGLRLAAKTVNQDDPRHYHLFYSDEAASPGADLTFFEYRGAPAGRAGSGMVHRIAWRVDSEAALDFWERRLGDEGVGTDRDERGAALRRPRGAGPRAGGERDRPAAEGAPPGDPRRARDRRLRGRARVRPGAGPQRGRCWRRSSAPRRPATGSGRSAARAAGAPSGSTRPPDERAVRGAGTVHHIAWGTTAPEHPLWHARLADAGVHVTEVIDRYYFHSVYFREPSGILYEIADDAPGFTRDMPLEELGSRVILPAWLEPRRDEIVAGLTPLPDPRALA